MINRIDINLNNDVIVLKLNKNLISKINKFIIKFNYKLKK
jgi:hypothetical protein